MRGTADSATDDNNGELRGARVSPVSGEHDAGGPLAGARGSSKVLRGTGGSTTGGENDDAAWAELYEWAAAQCWGPDCETTPRQQFDAYVVKLTELGLPVSSVR